MYLQQTPDQLGLIIYKKPLNCLQPCKFCINDIGIVSNISRKLHDSAVVVTQYSGKYQPKVTLPCKKTTPGLLCIQRLSCSYVDSNDQKTIIMLAATD